MEFPRHRSRASPRRLARRALRSRESDVPASDHRLRTDSTGTRAITLVAYTPTRGPRRASREETTVERAREDNAERF